MVYYGIATEVSICREREMIISLPPLKAMVVVLGAFMADPSLYYKGISIGVPLGVEWSTQTCTGYLHG